MRSLFAVVSQAEQEEIAVAAAIAGLRNRLGWREDSPARDEVLAEYAKLAAAAFAATRVCQGDEAAAPDNRGDEVQRDMAEALSVFETWYQTARGKPFWILFEHYMPETQLVDF